MERLRELRNKKSLSLREMADQLNMSFVTIGQYETGKRQPDNDTLKILADFFCVSTDYLLDRTNNKALYNIKNIAEIEGWNKVPVYNQISCGNGCMYDDEVIDYVAVPSSIIRSKECFAIPASGDSMINIGINEGDILIFRKEDLYEDNDIVAVCIDSEEIALCKRIKKVDDGSVLLLSENNKYPPVLITKDKRLRVVGKLVYSIKKF